MRFFNRKGKLWVDYAHNGRRIRKSLKVAYNKDNIELYSYNLNPKENNSFEYFAKRVLEWTKENKKQTTYDSYSKAFKRFVYYADIQDIKKITPYDIESVILKMQRDGLSPATIRRYLLIASLIFNEAIKNGIIIQNPIKLAKKPTSRRKIYPAFNENDIKILLEKSRGELQKFLYIALYTGARSGEVLGLKWGDIDFKEKLIHIERTKCINLKYGYDSPKTGNRTIYLLEPLKQYLGMRIIPNKNSYIFKSSYRTMLRNFIELLEKLGYEKTGLHSTRRSFIRVLMKKQADLALIQFMVGHSNLSMINNIYSGYLKDTKEDINKLEKAFA